jgi:hypothetical protein
MAKSCEIGEENGQGPVVICWCIDFAIFLSFEGSLKRARIWRGMAFLTAVYVKIHRSSESDIFQLLSISESQRCMKLKDMPRVQTPA